MSTNKVEEVVKKGAALLDSKKKGWALRVCVPELDMAEGTHCILGYVYGPNNRAESVYNADENGAKVCGYDTGMKRLFPKRQNDGWGGTYRSAHYDRDKEFGFDGRSSLRRFWLIEIGRRLAALAR